MNERSRFAIEVGLAVMLTCLAVCALAMSLAKKEEEEKEETSGEEQA